MKTLLSWLIKKLLLIEFAAFYLLEVMASNLRVARDVLFPSDRMNPAIFKVNVEGLTDRQVLVLANLVTMTPGTLSLDLVDNDRILLVHSLYVDDTGEASRELEEKFIRRICRVF